MCDGETGDHDQELSRAPQRNDQAEQEEQMVEPADDVGDADADESGRGTQPRSD